MNLEQDRCVVTCMMKVDEKAAELRKSNLIQVPVETDKKFAVEKPRRSVLNKIKEYFLQYCETTTIHGMRYVGERGRYFMERLMWIVIMLLVCGCCLLLLHKTYTKWASSPVIVTFAKTETPIYKIPFPAVTICPEVKFDPTRFNLTEMIMRKHRGQKFTKREEERLQIAYLVCDNRFGFNMTNWSKTIPLRLMNDLCTMQPYFDLFKNATVTWMGQIVSQYEFQTSFTSEGICYTFNMLPYREILRYENDFNISFKHEIKSRKWSLQDGYPPGDNFDAYPRKTFMNGVDGGLTIDALYTNQSHIDYLCKESFQGFKVALHHPCEFPSMETHFRLPLDQAVFVSIKPSLITVSQDLWNYSPNDRKCYLADEKYLASFKFYTQQNCLDECLANYTLAQCGCVPFYFPLMHHDTKVCGPARIECVKDSQFKYMELESNDKSNQQCECLPPCVSLSYNVETSHTDWDWERAINILPNNEKAATKQNTHLSRISVYYKDLEFLSCKRKELYGTIDFLSNMGGLLGLFIGFSVTSIIEMLYFCTLRLICNIKKYGNRPWFGNLENGDNN